MNNKQLIGSLTIYILALPGLLYLLADQVPSKMLLCSLLVIIGLWKWRTMGGIITSSYSSAILVFDHLYFANPPIYMVFTALSFGFIIFFGFNIVVTDVLSKVNRERQLLDSEDKFKLLANSAYDGVVIIDQHGRTIYWNKAAEKIFGYPAHFMLGKDLHQILLFPHQYELFIKGFTDFASTGKGNLIDKTVEVPARGKDNRKIPVEISVVAIPHESTWYAGAIIRDITQRKQAEAELFLKDCAVESSINGIALIDLNGVITYVNKSFLRMWGYNDSSEVVGSLAVRYWDKEVAVQKVLNKVIDQGSYIGELAARRQDNSIFFTQLSASMVNLEAGEETYVMASFVDISERKEVEEKLAIYTAEVELKSLQLELAYEKITENVQAARRLHQRLLTTNFPELEEFKFTSYYQPAGELGGDFYNVIRVGNQTLIYLVDVTGHGLDGAMLNIFVKNTINSYLLLQAKEAQEISAKDLVEFLAHQYHHEDFHHDYFVCLLVAVLDLSTQQLSCSNAGFQVLPLVYKQGQVEWLNCGGLPISAAIPFGLMKYEEVSIGLEPGNTIIFSTDGLVEEISEDTMYGEERLARVVQEWGHLPIEMVTRALEQDFQNFANDSMGQDDITLVGLQWTELVGKKQIILQTIFSRIQEVELDIQQFFAPYAEDLEMFLLGYHEMMVNAMEHGNKSNPNKQVIVTLEETSQYLLVTIEDEGPGFDWRQRMAKELDPFSLEERGRGIIMTRLGCDYLYYNDQGNKVTMIKKVQ